MDASKVSLMDGQDDEPPEAAVGAPSPAAAQRTRCRLRTKSSSEFDFSGARRTPMRLASGTLEASPGSDSAKTPSPIAAGRARGPSEITPMEKIRLARRKSPRGVAARKNGTPRKSGTLTGRFEAHKAFQAAASGFWKWGAAFAAAKWRSAQVKRRGREKRHQLHLRHGRWDTGAKAIRRRPRPTPDAQTPEAELRALLPRIWQHLRLAQPSAERTLSSRSAGPSGPVKAQAPVSALLAWLSQGKAKKAKAKWASAEALLETLRAVERLQELRQRLGFRFKDPSKTGTWSVNNVIGHSSKLLDVPGGGNHSFVSWDIYVATFRIRVLPAHTEGGGSAGTGEPLVEVVRVVGREPVSAHVEVRKHGEPGGPLPLKREHYTVTARSRCDKAGDGRKRIKVLRRMCDLLPAAIVRPPSGPHRWTLIYLHGLGSSAIDNYADRPHYFSDGSLALKVIVPTAPSRELSCFDTWFVPKRDPSPGTGRWKVNQFHSWYDYITNHDGKKEDSIDWESLAVVQRALHSLIEREAAELGGRTDRIILAGKSQGCCTALDAALSFPRPLGGFIGVVGHLLSCTPIEPVGAQKETPLHFFHEPKDEIMRWEWVKRGEQRLREAGYRVYSRKKPDPENHGHFVEGVEGAWVRSALRQICGKHYA